MVIVRALAGLVLGLAIFAGLFYSLVLGNFTQRLENPEVYNVAIEETDAYTRMYDEVLVDDALTDYASDLLGGVEAETQQEIVEILRDVMPPSYLKEQTEANIDRLTGYLRHDLDRLELVVDLSEPLERIEPLVQSRVDQFIDELEVMEPPADATAESPRQSHTSEPFECTDENLRRLAYDSAIPISELSEGNLPTSVPSLRILPRECREQQFDRWFEIVLDHPEMDSETARILESERASLRSSFVEGDTRDFLKQAAEPLTEPLVEQAVADTRRQLQRNDRLDLLDKLAENSDLSRDEIDEQAEFLRDTVSTANGPGRIVALLLVVIGSILLAVVYIPRPAEMLRWPGVTLFLGSGVCLVVGFVINSAVPGRIKDAIVHSTSYAPDVPTAAIDLAGDLLESFAQQSTAGFIPAAATVMAIGVVLVVASFFASALWAILRGILPSSGGDRGRR